MEDKRNQDNLDPQTRSDIGRKGGESQSKDENTGEIGKKGEDQSQSSGSSKNE